MCSRKGKFIVFEGIDGCGKSTQIKLLEEKCKKHNINIMTTREPTDNDVGRLIRNEYMQGSRYADSILLTMLLAADRYEHIMDPNDGLLKTLHNGINIFCDYYIMGGLVRQSMMDFCNDKEFWKTFEYILNTNKVNMELLMPDITIYLDVPAGVAYQRICDRKIEKELSIFETTHFLQAINHVYNVAISTMNNKFNDHVYIVDGNKNIDDIADDIWKIIYPLLKQD